MHPERGLALILVLWSLMLLTAIAVSFGYAVRVETAVATATSDQVRAEALAAAGIRRAIVGVLTEQEELRWPMDGRVRDIPWADAVLRVGVRSESGKIDINLAPAELLMGLFGNLLPASDAEALANAVLEHREQVGAQASAISRPRDGRQAKLAEAAGRAFRSVDELARLPGFDADGVWRLRPYLTVYGGSAKVDALSADLEVLAAIPGVSREAALKFARERAALAGDAGFLDLTLLGDGAAFVEAVAAPRVANIRAMAQLSGGAAATAECVLRLGGAGQPFELLEWRQSLAGAGTAFGE